MKHFIVLSLALVVLVIANCTIDKPLPGAYELLDRGNKGDVLVETFPAVKCGSYWTTPLAGSETTLMLGETNHLKAYLLLRFTNFTDAIDTMRISAATISMRQYSQAGDGNDFQASIYKVTGPWVADADDETDWESSVSWETIKETYDPTTSYGSFTGTPLDTIGTVTVTIDTGLVNEWINSDTNYGILMEVEQADLITLFYSSEYASNLVTLDLIQENNDATFDTVSVNVYQDATLLQFKTPVAEKELQSNPEFLRVGNGSGYRSLIQFDLSSLPAEATIHHALLTLNVNKDSSKCPTSGITIYASPVLADSTWDPEELSLYTLSSSPYAYAYGDYASFSYETSDDIKSMVSFAKAWHFGADNGGLANYGIALVPYDAGINVSEISFYSGVNDSTLTPTLRLTYSLPPSSRFSN